MDEEIVIKKEPIDIDDTKIKLEIDEDGPALELSCAGSFMNIIEERANMITVPVHEIKSEDELKFIASLSTLEQQQKLFVTSSAASVASPAVGYGEFACKICKLTCKNRSDLDAHQINHEQNRHFCCHGCGFWCNTLDEILEHEYRKHLDRLSSTKCRICQLECNGVASLNKHMISHNYVRRFVCSICRQHFELPMQLVLHRQNSKELCGQVKYVDHLGNVGQLVAVSEVDKTQPTEMLHDVEIKSEPLDVEDRQPETSDMVIKTEPPPEADEFISENDNSWSKNGFSEQLRSKLRLPAIKKPSMEECVAKEKVPSAVNPSMPSIKRKPIAIPNSTSSVKRPILVKTDNIDSQPTNTLSNISKNNTNNATNVLKVLPLNCMMVKLPPNTKIVKLAPTTAGKNTNIFTIGSKVITLPSSVSISSGTALPPPPPPPLTLSINRSSHLSAIGLFESLPESRKIITAFQNQIRNIEQTLPLPGSVLHPKTKSPNLSLPLVQVLRMPLTTASNAKVRQLRNAFSDYRFYWECPNCARCFEQYSAFCKHLTLGHEIDESKLEHLEVEVKSYMKSDSSIPQTSDYTLNISTVNATNPVVSSSAQSQAASKAAVVVPTHLQEAVTSSPVAKALEIVAAAQKSLAPVQIPPSLAKPATSYLPALYECTECSKCFTTKGGLRIHQMIHTGELPHKCSFCEKRFRTPGQVRVHHRRHTGEKPFKCTVCALDFTHRETLISHLSRHIGMKRYKCYGCDKNFVVVSGLRAHRRLRPDTCGKVKFTARAHGPRVRVIRGKVFFEPHPQHNGYLRSEDPLNIMSEIIQTSKEPSVATKSRDD